MSDFLPEMHAGTFLRRYKRFFADVQMESGERLTLHCANTGAMTGLLQEGCRALFSLASAEEQKRRKTPGSLEALQIEVSGQKYWVGVNTHRANQLAARWLSRPEVLSRWTIERLQPEVKLATLIENFQSKIELADQQTLKTRVDFVGYRPGALPLLIEVKSVTLLECGQGFFPDAVSSRATQQLQDLLWMKSLGFDVLILYVSQHQGISHVEPAAHIDPAYAATVEHAKKHNIYFHTLPFAEDMYS